MKASLQSRIDGEWQCISHENDLRKAQIAAELMKYCDHGLWRAISYENACPFCEGDGHE